VENFCKRVIWIDNGSIREDGEGSKVMLNYMSTFGQHHGSEIDLNNFKERLF